MILRGRAVMFFGMVKTIKTVTPMDAITTPFSIVSSNSTMKITTVAKNSGIDNSSIIQGTWSLSVTSAGTQMIWLHLAFLVNSLCQE